MPAKRKNTPPKVHVATALEYAAQIAEAAGYELALVPKGSDYPPESLRIAPVLAEKHALGGRR